MRLDKFLSESSCYSRSEVHKLIKKSLIIADGKVAKTPDTKVTEKSVTSYFFFLILFYF